jgi:uncharacterized protein
MIEQNNAVVVGLIALRSFIVDTGVEIPVSELAPELLLKVIEDFVTREGTDYGFGEWSLTDKVSQVEGQLRRREAVVVFDPDSETVSILPRQ